MYHSSSSLKHGDPCLLSGTYILVMSPNCAKIKFMASNRNSIQRRGAARKLSRSPKHQEFKSSPRKDPKRLPRSLSHQGNHKMSKWLKGSNIQIAKRSMLSELLRDSNCQEVKIAKGPTCPKSKGPRDLCYPSYQEIQMSKSFPEKSMLSKVELFLIIAFTCIVKGPLLEPMNLAL